MVLQRAAAIRGQVRYQGQALRGFSVNLTGKQDSGNVAKASPEEGIFEFSGLKPGLKTLKVEVTGFIPQGHDEVLREGEVARIDFEMRPASQVSATVLDGKGRPLPRAEAWVRTEGQDGKFLSDDERRRLGEVRPRGDEKGHLVIGPLGRGLRYRCVFRVEGRPLRSLVLTPSAPVVKRDIRLPPGGTLRLSVKDANGQPISGAVARLDSDDAPDLDLLAESLPSSTDGTLRLGPLPEGTYSLRLRAEGFRPATLRGCIVKDGAATDQGVIRLAPGLEVSGTVRTADGVPISGASVRARFYESGRQLSLLRKSSPKGSFQLTGLPAGSIEIEAEARGYVPKKLDDIEAGKADLEIVLSEAGSLVGQVLAKDTGIPVPIFSLLLRVDGGRGGFWNPRGGPATFRDDEGAFRLDGLTPGLYKIEAIARGYQPATLEAVQVEPGDSKALEIRLERGLGVHGVVRDVENGEAVLGATVRVPGLPSVETDSEGAFEVEGLSRRSMIEVQHPRYMTELIRDLDTERKEPIEILLHRGGAVEGMVFGKGGVPLAGAEVRTLDPMGQKSVSTGPDGRYFLEGLHTGPQALAKVDVPGTYEGYESAVVSIEAGLTRTHDFGRGIRLHGTVTYGGGPAADARLTLTQNASGLPEGSRLGGSISARSREDGSYEAQGLGPGTYGLVVAWQQARTGKQITLSEGESTVRMDIDIPDLWLTGEVVDKETRLPLKATVLAWQVGKDNSPNRAMFVADGESAIEFNTNPQARSASDAQGRFRVQLMELGRYRLTAIASGYRMEEAVEVEVQGSTGDLSIEMTPAKSLKVTAFDSSNGKPLELDCAQASWESNSSIMCGTGPARFTSLKPGPMLISVDVAGYAVGYQKLELKEDQEEVKVPVTRGGRLRLLLPGEMNRSTVASMLRANLHIVDDAGVDLTVISPALRRWLETSDGSSSDGAVVLPNIPPGRLRISLGGKGTSLESKEIEVQVEAEQEAAADFR
ncbi:MAG TPA: carboxypeptidase regulatory-like domain-containing protein [Candidatus Polarisedimenticolia bacterium]|nr:carboxypeptidase regulatory-like domain-containing protein [Candidatus Polarisedimenticolia bacterium]